MATELRVSLVCTVVVAPPEETTAPACSRVSLPALALIRSTTVNPLPSAMPPKVSPGEMVLTAPLIVTSMPDPSSMPELAAKRSATVN